jgi:HSP20 family protein
MSLLPAKFRSKTPVAYNPTVGFGLSSLQREMNSLMNNFFDWGDYPAYPNLANELYPSVDVKETESKYVLDADLPGMREKDISLEVRNNILTISGKADTEVKDMENGYVCLERVHKSFSRDIYLGEDVDTDSIRAELKEGVLHVEVNKSEQVKKNHKKIPIKH